MNVSTVPAGENKMGTMPIPKLLFSMAVPMMASMLIQALYNVVDSIFVARLSEDALTAVSLAFPMQNLMIAAGSGIGVGMNAVLSKKLGERNPEEASKAAVNGIFLSILSYLIFLVIGLFATPLYFRAQTDIDVIIDGGISYLSIVCIFSFGLFLQISMERLLQSTGNTIYSMITQATGAIINIIFDPIMIFGLFGFPKMGIAGAAAATVLGQIIAAGLGIFFNITKNKEIHIHLKGFRPCLDTIGKILGVGIPSIIMVAIGSVTTFGMNKILMGFTSTAAAVFGAYYKLQSFIMMPVFGLNNGMVPIIAFNYGARKGDRVSKTIKLSILTAIVIMLIGIFLLQAFPETLLGMFDASENMIQIGVPALRTISLSFIFAGFCIVCSSVFQAFGNGVLSMLSSIARQLVVLLPAAWLLSLTNRLELVWYAYPIAEIMSMILSCIFLKRIYNTIIKNLD